jgi:hypothetical protein
VSEASSRNGRHRPGGRVPPFLLVVVAILCLAVLWQQVFAMTGLLWWNAPAEAARWPRPATPRLPVYDTSWVDVDAYMHTHPVCQF